MCLTKNAKNHIFMGGKLSFSCERVNSVGMRFFSCSHANTLNNNNKSVLCEQVNVFSRAYVRVHFFTPLISILNHNISLFIFCVLVCVSVLLFTCSHFKKINIKTTTYRVNDLEKLFTRCSHVHMTYIFTFTNDLRN